MINSIEINKDSAYDIPIIRSQPFQPKLKVYIFFIYLSSICGN